LNFLLHGICSLSVFRDTPDVSQEWWMAYFENSY
jgi:hypothetical protein